MTGKDQLVEEITRRVLTALESEHGVDQCASCRGGCAANCTDKVRSMVAEGASRISYNGRGTEVPRDLASYIDHTLLAPDTTAEQIDQLCAEALEYHFAAVCVNPVWVKRAVSNLRDSEVKTASVVGFPLGATSTDIKVMETRRALRDGAREIDMVINIGALKGGELDLVRRDIARVADACREVGAVCKVIIETGILTDEEKVTASRLAQLGRAHFVKTSTGFGHGGAKLFDVALMRETVGPNMGIKASGGVKNARDAEEMIAAGATRIGASAGISIVSGGKSGGGSGGY